LSKWTIVPLVLSYASAGSRRSALNGMGGGGA
jgi:hypothetical protein